MDARYDTMALFFAERSVHRVLSAIEPPRVRLRQFLRYAGRHADGGCGGINNNNTDAMARTSAPNWAFDTALTSLEVEDMAGGGGGDHPLSGIFSSS
jgi:hypothetical protein